jgi:hypothetical protein
MGGVRRSGRIAKQIRILLLGTDTSGRVFAEETRTVVLSRHGAGIVSKHKVAPDERLTLRVLGASASTEAAVRLVGPMDEDGHGYTYGVAFADSDLDFWQIEFPPPPQWAGDSDSMLECGLCHTREVVQQSEIEADVYALTRGILRSCQKCGNATVWRKAAPNAVPAATAPADTAPKSADPEPGPAVAVTDAGSATTEPVDMPATHSRMTSSAKPAAAQPQAERAALVGVAALRETLPPPQPLRPAATAVVARASNRRRDVRTRVSFTVCVRQGDAGEEIVECDNISKRGISFRSRKSYAMDSAIEVAAPYSPGWPAVFVPACIKHVDELPGATLFRYGVAYVPKTSGNS